MSVPPPLDNNAFRALLQQQLSHTRKQRDSQPHSHQQQLQKNKAVMPPAPKSTKRLESYQRYLTKKQEKEESKLQHSKPSKQVLVVPDDSISMSVADRLSVEERQLLGGDQAHTHLVKGLDYALLNNIRSKHHQQQTNTQTQQTTATIHTTHAADTQAGRETLSAAIGRACASPSVPVSVTPWSLFLPGRLSFSFPLLDNISTLPSHSHAHTTAASLYPIPLSVMSAAEAEDETTLHLQHQQQEDAVSGWISKSLRQQIQVRLADTQSHKETQQTGREEQTEEKAQQLQTIQDKRQRGMDDDDDDIFPSASLPDTGSASETQPPLLLQTSAGSCSYFADSKQATSSMAASVPYSHSLGAVSTPAVTSSPSLGSSQPVSSRLPSLFSSSSEYDEYDYNVGSMMMADEDEDEHEQKDDGESKAASRSTAGSKKRSRESVSSASVVSKRREAKLESQLHGVEELLKADGSALTLEKLEGKQMRHKQHNDISIDLI